MRPYASTARQMAIKREWHEHKKARRQNNAVRVETKAARRAGRLEIEREVIEDKIARAVLEAEERAWREQMRLHEEAMLDLVRDEDQDDLYWYDDEPEPHVSYDDDYYCYALEDF